MLRSDPVLLAEKDKRNFRTRVDTRRKKSSNGCESRTKIGSTSISIDSFFSPQAPKDPSEDKDEKNDFFPTDPDSVNYIVHLNDTNFDTFIAEHPQSPVLAMFYAPCKDLSTKIVAPTVSVAFI